jgi:hypothetical protein
MLAAAYELAGRRDNARASAAKAFQLRPDTSLLTVRQRILSHIGDANALDVIIGALRRAGFPDWPYGFTPGNRPQLTGEEIGRLAYGHTWQGQIEPGRPAIMEIGKDGRIAFRSPLRLITGTVHIDHDNLCEQSEYFLENADCGPVFGPEKKTDTAVYTYVNSGNVFHFSVVH